jgi:hypothetical protein|tara:strand:- start:460 stop:1233 length:774 start_codon:yes stop_codon:yes gene_type:complete
MNMNAFTHRVLGTLTVFAVLLASGCRENNESGILNLNTNLSWHGVELSIGDTVYDYMNRPVRPEKFNCYVSNFSLRSEEGEWINSSSISRLDFFPLSASANGEFSSQKLRCADTFNAIKFNVGVPSELNQGIEPTSYPNSHPLSVTGSAGMRWDMHNSYFFVKFEGKLAEEDGGSISTPFIFHCATDPLYRTVVIETNSFSFHTNDDLEFQLDLDLGLALEGGAGDLDLSQVGHSMGEVPNAIMFMDNLTTSWTLKE